MTTRDVDAAAEFLAGVPFPAARDDLLLQAILLHATPRLIGDLRALPEGLYPDRDAVLEALRAS